MAAAVQEDFSNATDVADYLVRKGIPFRTAHDLVGQIVRICLAEGILLRDLPLERWKTFHPAFEADILTAIEPRQVVATRLSAGGTGFAVVREALQRAQARHQQPEPSEETPQT
jgi:argininosuccinate lyase